MRASINPRISTAKAASWPLISGSLLGNKSSWFDKSLYDLSAISFPQAAASAVAGLVEALRAPSECSEPSLILCCQVVMADLASGRAWLLLLIDQSLGRGGGGGAGMFGIFGTFPVLVESGCSGRGGDGGGSGLGSRGIKSSPYEKSRLSTLSASDCARLSQRFTLGQRTPHFSSSFSFARKLLEVTLAVVSSIVPSFKSYHSRSHSKYSVSYSQDIFINSFSFLKKGKNSSPTCAIWLIAIIAAQIIVCSFQIVQVATVENEISAKPNAKQRPIRSDCLEHSDVYRALNLMLARFFQMRVRVGFKGAGAL